MENKHLLAPSPHLTGGETVTKIMWKVSASLLPATAVGVYIFGVRALLVVVVSVAAAMLTEFFFLKIRNLDTTRVLDGSAALTGLILALTLPPTLPLFAVVMGAVVAIALGKQIFGGLGNNVFNPALVGRAFLAATYPVFMTTWSNPNYWKALQKVDAINVATPLANFKFEQKLAPSAKLLFGTIAGSIGETSAIALLVGAVYLLYKKYINWRMPVGYLGTVIVLSGIMYMINPDKYPTPTFMILAGGLILGAFYIATDPVTTPFTNKGIWIFSFGAGVLVILIRIFGGLPEGVLFSILFMNTLTPVINKWTQPKVFGHDG